MLSLYDLQNFANAHETLVIGATTYISGLLLLPIIEKRMNNGGWSMFPHDKNALSAFDRDTPWITPTTMDSFRSTPTLEQLQERPILIGTRRGACQFITLESCKIIPGVQELHPDWTNIYGVDVFIYKKKLL